MKRLPRSSIFVLSINNQNILMMIQVIQKFKNATLKVQGFITLICLGLYFLSSYFLEKSYLLSKFPVSYFEQQTSFDAIKMKEWYAFMLKEETFGIYLNTQIIDFVFIATVILAGYVLWSFIANSHPSNSFFNTWGQKLAYCLPLAGVFDILENLVSFFMIANPVNFIDFLVIPYSTFAVLKFASWTVGLTWLLVSILALPFTKFRHTKTLSIISLFLLGFSFSGFAQNNAVEKENEALIYIEADPFAYINKGYSIHLGYENWGMRFDLTKVKVDFPERFEEAFYNTKEFDLVTNISGIKIDYIGNRSNWTKNAFIGVDINYQKQSFTHRKTFQSKNLNTINLGLRAGYKIPILFKGFYITPWAALWKNTASNQSFIVNGDSISTLEWDWIATIHFGYAIKI